MCHFNRSIQREHIIIAFIVRLDAICVHFLLKLNSIFIISLFRMNRMKWKYNYGCCHRRIIHDLSIFLAWVTHTHTLEQNWFIHKVQTTFNDVLPFDSMTWHVISFHFIRPIRISLGSACALCAASFRVVCR